MIAGSARRRSASEPGEPRPRKRADPAGKAINLHVAKKMKYLRITNGKTQREMAEVLGLNYQQIHKYENGISRITLEKLWITAKFFNVGIPYFFQDLDPSILEPAIEPNFGGAPEDVSESSRLQVAMGRALLQIASAQVLRGLLTYIRAIAGASGTEPPT
jgi:transcriptional regulator with XRE-family HTH domain